MWHTKESVPPGDEARGGNWFQMKQEVESGDKERVVLDKGKGGRPPSVDTNTHTLNQHLLPEHQKRNVSLSLLPILYICPFFNLIP